jgi:molybdate transport system permease protein
MNDLWQPMSLSLRVAMAATIVAALVALPLALVMSRRRFVGKNLVEALIVVPLVLPPTVVGYAIIVLLGAHGWIGRWAFHAWRYTILFRFEGAVLAAAIVAFPLLYLPAKAAFAGVDRELEDQARLFGANRLQLFWHVTLPLARRGLFSGLVLCAARALGEFGATVMVYGITPGQLTLPVSIYIDTTNGDWSHAAPAVIALSVVSLLLVMAFNRSSAGRQD